MLRRANRHVSFKDKGSRCSSNSGGGTLLLVGASAWALAVLRLLVVVVSVAVVVDVAEHSLRLLFGAASFVHHRIQRPGPGLGACLQAAPAGGAPRARPVIHKWVIVTAQRAAEGGPAAINPLQRHVGTVQNRVAGGAVAGPRAGVACRPIGQVPTAFRVVAAPRAAAVVLPIVGWRPAVLRRDGGGVVQT